MRIDIDDKYCITSDKDQITVNTKSLVKTDEKREGGLKAGDERLTGIAYVSTIQQAYKYLFQLKVRLSDATDFRSLMKEVEAFEEELRRSIRI
jgi:hypothetical protein